MTRAVKKGYGERAKVVFRGKTPAHSLSTHPTWRGPAYVIYELSEPYEVFTGTAAIMDSAGDRKFTPLVFKVLGDGRLLWKSRPIQKRGDGQKFAVPIRGIRTFRLQVDCPGDASRGFAVWISPRLFKTVDSYITQSSSIGDPSPKPTENHYLRDPLRKDLTFHDWRNKSWKINAKSDFRFTEVKSGFRLTCESNSGYKHRLVLFPQENVQKKKLVASFRVEFGSLQIGFRPRNMAPRGLEIQYDFEPGKLYQIQLWLEGGASRCLVNGKPATIAHSIQDYGYFALIPGRQSSVVFHQLHFVHKPQLLASAAWVDLLTLVDVEKHGFAVGKNNPVKKKTWVRQGGGVRNIEPTSSLLIPATVETSYEFRAKFVRLSGVEVHFHLPVGKRSCLLVLDGWNRKMSGFEMVDGKDSTNNPTTIRRAILKDRRQHFLLVGVYIAAGEATLLVKLDGKLLISHKSKPAALSVKPNFRLPQPSAFGIGSGASRLMFREVKLRTHGKLKPLN